MIVCLCHPFSDKKVREHLDSKAASASKSSVGEVYSVCSDGKTPQCCTCLATLRDIVKTHNRAIMGSAP